MDVPIDVSHTTIRTSRLTLRPPEPGDLEDFHAYASVPGLGEMAGWKHHESMEKTEAVLQRMIDKKVAFAIIHKSDGKMIGILSMHPSWVNEDEAYRRYKATEFGYSIAEAYWGQGLMTEAVRAAIAYCFDTLKLDALTCGHFAENDRSRRVIEKCGFTFVKSGTVYLERLQKTFQDCKYILFRDIQNGESRE